MKGIINFEYPSSAVLSGPMLFDPVAVNNRINADPGTRFVSLLELPESPLNRFPGSRIVPGTEKVVGPDQRHGPHYGFPIQYTRVSGNDLPNKNEYKINYLPSNQGDPNLTDPNSPPLKAGYIVFNSQVETSTHEDPEENSTVNPPQIPVYLENSLPQIRYNRVTRTNEATAPLEITFNFQTNRPGDVVKVDYMTREFINVSIEARLYDQRTGTPQITSLTNKMKVRNLQR